VIVELIGCDGAGKTTLGRLLTEPGVLGGRSVGMADLVLDHPGLRGITHPTARNVVQELGGLPFLFRAYPRRRAYLAFAWRMHTRYAPSAYHRLNGMRGIARRVGMYELARSRAADRIVLSDEGTVLSAYLFALTGVPFDRSDVERFAELVPSPDRIIYVKAPIASLIERALSRPDRRTQHAGKSRSAVERTIRRTMDVFDVVAGAPPLRDRVLVVENDGDRDRLQRLSTDLASELRVWAAASSSVGAHEAVRVASDGLQVDSRR
jgi:thymidylate kinase